STGILARAFWKGARSVAGQNAVIDDTLKKIYDPTFRSAVLGFADGGLVRGDRIARVGERGPELIVPLGNALRTFEVRSAFEDLFRAATASSFGAIQRELRDLAGLATFGGGTRAGVVDAFRGAARALPLRPTLTQAPAPSAPPAPSAAPVHQTINVTVQVIVDATLDLTDPDAVS